MGTTFENTKAWFIVWLSRFFVNGRKAPWEISSGPAAAAVATFPRCHALRRLPVGNDTPIDSEIAWFPKGVILFAESVSFVKAQLCRIRKLKILCAVTSAHALELESGCTTVLAQGEKLFNRTLSTIQLVFTASSYILWVLGGCGGSMQWDVNTCPRSVDEAGRRQTRSFGIAGTRHRFNFSAVLNT